MGVQELGAGFLNGANTAFIEGLYQKYLEDPTSVDESWAQFFSEVGDDIATVEREAQGPSWGRTTEEMGVDDPYELIGPAVKAAQRSEQLGHSEARAATLDSLRALMLIRAYRVRGHLIAHLDPLQLSTMLHSTERSVQQMLEGHLPFWGKQELAEGARPEQDQVRRRAGFERRRVEAAGGGGVGQEGMGPVGIGMVQMPDPRRLAHHLHHVEVTVGVEGVAGVVGGEADRDAAGLHLVDDGDPPAARRAGGVPVLQVIGRHLFATLLLMISSTIISVGFGTAIEIPSGV